MKFNKLDEIKVFRDPIYTYIKVSYEVIWELINTKEFQRLRRISQLGGVQVIYHTAEHSRFSHSLGVYNLAKRVIDDVTDIKEKLTEKEKVAVMCAGLLHDVGHGPFSHAFEDAFHLNHENYTCEIIRGNTQINKALANVDKDFPDFVASIIEKTNPNSLLSSIVSSQLDVDRADYLQRDSYFTGATYGAIDIARITRTMRIKDDQIVFKTSGVHSIEDYLLSRYQMYWQVYFHPTARSYELILNNIFARIKDLYEEGYKFNTNISRIIPAITKEKVSVEEYLRLDDIIVKAMFIEMIDEEDEILSDLTNRFINRDLFKDVEWHEEENGILISKYDELKEELEKLGIASKYYLTKDMPSQYIYRNMNTDVNKIKLIDKKGKIVSVDDYSPVLSGLSSMENKKDFRIFYPRTIKNINVEDIIKNMMKD